MSALVLNYSNSGDLSTETAIARGLVTHVVHVRPTTNGLAQITVGDSPSNLQPAGASLQSGLGQAGRTAQLSLALR